MRITETIKVEREIHVAPCLKCGGDDIILSDDGYSAFNLGGGKCRKCGHEVSAAVGIFPKPAQLAAIWNARNDLPILIAAEEAKIAAAREAIGTYEEAQKIRSKGNE